MKKQIPFLLLGLILSVVLQSPLTIFAQTNTGDQLAAKMKAKIEAVGVGPIVSIRLQNKTKLKGHIARINPDDFIVRVIETGKEQTFTYRDVTQVKLADKRGMSTGVIVAIVVVGVIFVASYIGNVLRN